MLCVVQSDSDGLKFLGQFVGGYALVIAGVFVALGWAYADVE
jgi:hypothetical protein